MMPARQTRDEYARPRERIAPEPHAAPEAQHAAAAGWVFTPDGRLVTGGAVALRESADGWKATLTKLDRPGMVATLYFAEGLREVSLQLEDGRCGRARITSTTFVASAERVCELTGLDRLA